MLFGQPRKGKPNYGVVMAETDSIAPAESDIPYNTKAVCGCYTKEEATLIMCQIIDKYLKDGYEMFDNQDREMIVIKKVLYTPYNFNHKQYILVGYRNLHREDNIMRVRDDD